MDATIRERRRSSGGYMEPYRALGDHKTRMIERRALQNLRKSINEQQHAFQIRKWGEVWRAIYARNGVGRPPKNKVFQHARA